MNSRYKKTNRTPGNFSRRRFISSCAACGACVAFSPLAFGELNSSGEGKKMTIRILYSLHEVIQDRADWPNIGFNFEPIINNFNAVLKKQFPNFSFISTMATGQEDAENIVLQDKNGKNVNGYIVFQMNPWNKVVQTIAKTKKPVLYVDFKYGGSGGLLVYNAKFLREKQSNVGFVSSSKTEDLIAAVKCFENLKENEASDFSSLTSHARLKLTPTPGDLSCKPDIISALSIKEYQEKIKNSKILAVRDQSSSVAKPVMGIPLQYISFAEINSAWENADKDEAQEIAQKWQNSASSVVDVPFEELQNSAAMFLGMKSVLKRYNANAITINCLGGFYGDHIHAYPCLGFHELNNEGLVGACECDISSTATMVAFNTLTQGRPGYISDPVIDTSKRQIIYAHCVASNKVFGPNGPTNPFTIMTHSEDRKGAAVRSILPVDYLTTTLKINDERKEIVFHQAKAVDNDLDDRACRTKLCAEPIGDIEKLFTEWDQWGWHRVTFYGDMKEQIYDLADSIGWKVTKEA